MKRTLPAWGALLAACGGAPPPSPVAPGTVEYALASNIDGATRAGDGLSFTTADGVHVRLTAASLVTHSMSLIPCESMQLALRAEGHGSVIADESTVEQVVVEPLLTGGELVYATVQVPPQRYCGVHHLAGRGGEDLQPELQGVTLRVDGRQGTGSTDDAPLTIRTAFAYGAVTEIPPLDLGTTSARITVARDVPRMFDGVDFADTEQTRDWRTLQSLVGGVTVKVEPR